jgi:hypothetical protein
MEHDIERAIHLIDAKIKKLVDAKQTLLDLFGSNQIRVDNAESTASLKPTSFSHGTQEPRLSRRQEVIKILTEKGPLSKKDILGITDMPRGSLSFTLSDKTKFYSQDGKWHLVGDKSQLEAPKQADSSPATQNNLL